MQTDYRWTRVLTAAICDAAMQHVTSVTLNKKYADCFHSLSHRLYLLSYINFLWPPYGIGQAIIFSSCGFFLLLLFFVLA